MTFFKMAKLSLWLHYGYQIIALWCLIVSWNLVITGLGNGLVLKRWQAISFTNTDLLSIGLWGTDFSEMLINKSIYHDGHYENDFKQVLWQMLVILFLSQYIRYWYWHSLMSSCASSPLLLVDPLSCQCVSLSPPMSALCKGLIGCLLELL